MISAPHSSNSWRLSTETLVGITALRWYPFTRHTMARPMPVLPEVGSIRIWSGSPGRSTPRRSASSISDSATRSFTEPPGFWPSSLMAIRASGFGLSALDVDQRRIADHVEHRGVGRPGAGAQTGLRRHCRLASSATRRLPQPPATAGRMDTSAPSGTGVSRPCK